MINELNNRNALIQKMLSSGDIQNFYRFVAQNPHITLHDACQILINRPSVSVCFSFKEWGEMGRRITKGRKGIPYYDEYGGRHFVFDMNDTNGEKRYQRTIYPMKRLLQGLDILNGTNLATDKRSDYRKIQIGVSTYLGQNGYFTNDELHNTLLIEGATHYLYSKTGFPKTNGIALHGMPYSLQENAKLFSGVCDVSALLHKEIDEAYVNKGEAVEVVDDTNEETFSDEPTLNTHQNLVEIHSASRSNYKDYVVLVHYTHPNEVNTSEEIYLGKKENYTIGVYDNTDNSLIYISDNPVMYSFLRGGGWVKTQQQMLEEGIFTEEDYKEFYDLQQSVLKDLECINEIKFGIDTSIPNSGIAFQFHNQQDNSPNEQVEELPKETTKVTPFYQEYLNAQKKYPEAVVLIRLGDFYEVMGENAVFVAKELDMMLTGRDVGLSERVPMCGFPYHAAERYIEKVLDKRPVAVVEDNEIRYILAHAQTISEEEKPILEETDEGSPFDENETISEEQDNDGYYADEDFDDDDISDEQEENESEQQPKSISVKGVKDRKRKVKPQLSMFDLLEPQELSRKEEMIIRQLKYGSGFENGRIRIYQKYEENPTIKDFAQFLKNEYGIGGYSARGSDGQWHDGKGIKMSIEDDNGKNIEEAFLKWDEVAVRIADLIDEDNYLTQEEKAKLFGKAEKLNLDDEEDKDWDTAIANGALKPIHAEQKESSENTNLAEILDQSELGGAKTRFKGNVQAIKLVNELYKSVRLPTQDEKKVLAKYVGWGGLAQAFDEHNESWQKEYKELKDLLPIADYEQAKSSVLNAHYTSKEIIEGIYKALARFGVKGNNRILEPALGTGNFFGFMPQEIADNAKLCGVELDNITGRIASKLYPQAQVLIKGFEDTTFPNNHFDIVVGNVPFGAYSIYDSEYAKQNFYIHDYFIAKSIDKLKPKGIMAVITSSGTMDKVSFKVREYLADRAELLGAIRLPDTAFKQTAGTEVVADILFFQKRSEKIHANSEDCEWLLTGKTEQGYDINSYFLNHPEMVLGNFKEEHGLYGAMGLTVKLEDRDLSTALNEAIKNLPENFYINPERTLDTEEQEIVLDYNLKQLCYKAENGKVFMRVGERMEEVVVPKSPKDAYDRICGMINLRSELRHILEIQSSGCSDEVLQQEQSELNRRYDSFVKKYGILNSQTNVRLFKDDADSALLFACENLSEDKKTVTKADVFTKRTIRPFVTVSHTDDCFEALQISKNERGEVDVAYIEELTGKNYETVIKELSGSVFRNPAHVNPNDQYSGFESEEEYLSGNVVQKLAAAEQFLRDYPEMGYEKNVAALKEVQPEPIKASDISVRIGASWLDTSYYKAFLYELLDLPKYLSDAVQIYYNRHDSSWRIDKGKYIKGYSHMKVNEVYGTERANAYRLFEDCLNLKSTTIYDMVDDGHGEMKRVLNQAETIAAREKQNAIKEAFKDWIFSKPERREDLERVYNAKFNQLRLPSYDGSYLHFPEMNPAIELKPHQKNAVHRIITSGNTLLHHVVGSGKTYTICAAIMKLRQYGLANKPMIVVPNHLVQQWAVEFRTLYPNAKLLITSNEDLEKDKRKKFVSHVALGDWDAVIIAQSTFAKIPVSRERQQSKIQEEIKRIETTIEKTSVEQDMPSGAVKTLERIKKNREAQLKKLMDENKKDDVLIFENLGVDYLFVDEAHYYKNKFLFTKMNNVAGISTTASQRASDLDLKCEYLNELHGCDKGVVFATGTPISNSMTEMYTMQSYLQRNTLNELGLTYFDGWAADFGETVTSLEMAPSGQGYKARTRFAKFTNLPELLTLYRSFSDVQTSDMVKLDVPIADKKVINLKPSDTVLELADEIAARAEKISLGGVPPEEDNMLKVTSDGKKLALDPRCFERTASDEQGSKINECAFRIKEIWDLTKAMRGTQIVFCDLSTPKKAFEDYEYGKDFDVYNDLKYKLVQMGIPKEEIAYIHEANSDTQKQNLYDKVNAGIVRILIGSTDKCGAGTNVQQRLYALHHLDTPYRPSDMEQREGRIVRQGNINGEVKIFTYVTERTFDSYSYQILENKQRFISQINNGNLTMREAEDIDETTLSYAEIKAITAANPKIKRKMEVDMEVNRLRVLEGQYKKNLYAVQDKVRKFYPDEIRRQQLYIERLKADIQTVKENYNPENFSISVNGTVCTDKKLGGAALMDALNASTPNTVVAEFAGFKISLDPLILLTVERSITLSAAGKYTMEIGQSASGLLTRLDNFFAEFPTRQLLAENKLNQLQSDLAVAEEQIKKPFEHREKLEELVKEQAELNNELDLNRHEEVVIDDGKEDNTPTDENFMALPRKTSLNEEDTFIDSEEKIMQAQQVRYEKLKAFIDKGIAEINWNGTGGYAEEDVDDMVDTFKSIFEGSEFDESSEDIPFDYWYDSFAEDELRPYLQDNVSKQIGGVVVNEPPKTLLERVRESVESEYAEFEKYEMTRTFVQLMHEDNYRIRFYNELSGYFSDDIEDNLTDRDFEALLEDSPHILNDLYDYYLGNEYASINTYSDVADLIMAYNDKYHEEIVEDRYTYSADKNKGNLIYFGRDTGNTGYYYAPESLDSDMLEDLTAEAADYVIVSPINKLTDSQSESKHIFYLEVGKDIEVDEISDSSKAINNMQSAIYRVQSEKAQKYRDELRINRECKEAIENGISANFDGMYLKSGFENDVIEKYGLERVEYVLANTVQENLDDGRFSADNKKWAQSITINESLGHRRQFAVTSHPAVLDGFINRIRKINQFNKEESKELEANKYLKTTKQGYEVVNMTKDMDKRNIAIIKRENDYVVAAGYDTNTGTWAQGFYDYKDLKDAEKFREEKYGTKETPKRTWLTVNVSQDARIKAFKKYSFMRMPTTGKYANYTYNIYNSRIFDTTILTDLQSDSRELGLAIKLGEDDTVVLKDRDKDEVTITATEFKELVHNTSSKDYVRAKADDGKGWVSISVPREALYGTYDNSSLFAMPKDSKHDGYSFYVPNTFVEEDKENDDGCILISVPEDFTFNTKNKDTNDKITLTAKQMFNLLNNKKAEDFATNKRTQTGNAASEGNGWNYVSVNETAKVLEYDERTLFRMPQGEYEGYCYYIPNKLLRANEEKGTIRISLPAGFVVTATNKQIENEDERSIAMNVEEFLAQVQDKSESDYENYTKPSMSRKDKFADVDDNLTKNVPEEMKAKARWAIVRTKLNEEKGRVEKFIIDCHTGKMAKSDDSDTWTTFDKAREYAHQNGGVALAYALDGNDKIACIDIDHCFDENGVPTDTAKEVLAKCGDTYTERSVSGKGLHIFGKTKGLDLRTYSKDGNLEFYQKGQFIAMTGNGVECNNLADFDTPAMKELFERKFDKRTPLVGTSKGIEGLSRMSDRDVVERASNSGDGERFKALYAGEDLKHNHSNSDMALMCSLAFWCNGDKEQMLRIFATSGLYRPEKSDNYYECTVIKAIKSNIGRFQPNEQVKTTSNSLKNNLEKGGK